MASLANQTISSTYDGLIKTSTDQPVGISGVQLLEDGVGNSLALSVGRANQGVTITGTLTATSISGVLADGVTATTQSAGDNSTKVATTAYVDAQVTASDLDFAGDSGTGAVDLDSQSLTIAGTANEIETSASGQTITVGLPSTITANVTGNVSGNLTGDVTGDLTGTVLTAAQPNITSVGTLSSLTVAGALNGTISTAAQPNITSVGTLSSLAVSGDLTVDTNTLYVDAANNRVGVGTPAPESLLHIAATNAAQTDPLLANTKLRFTDNDPTQNNGQITGTIEWETKDSDNAGIQAYITSISTNTGAGNLAFATGLGGAAAERMRIDSSGNVQLQTVNAQLRFQNTAGPAPFIANAGTYAQDLYVSTGGAERMRITSGGDVAIGTTSVINSAKLSVDAGGAANGISIEVDATGGYTGISLNRTASNGDAISFNRGASGVGSISLNSSSTSYNTSSDYRLKENVVPMEGALDRVSQLQPSRFNFIVDPEKTVDGFLAHEVAEVVPEAVTGQKDAVDEEGNPVYQGIDQSKLVPLLVGAIQELKAEIETLKSQING